MNRRRQIAATVTGVAFIAFRVVAFIALTPVIVGGVLSGQYGGALFFALILAACCGGAGNSASD